MRKLALVVVFLAACGRKHPAPSAGLTIAITADGFVKVDGKAVTLDELATLLAARRAAAPLEEVGPFNAKASILPVLLDLDDGAAWGHVQWVMNVLEEQRFWRLSFPGGRQVRLPVDSSGCTDTKPDGKALLVRAAALESGAYLLGDRTTRDVSELARWIERAPRAGVLCQVGELDAQPRTPWKCVRPLFDMLHDRGRLEPAAFFAPLPTREVRGLSPLPPAGARKPWSGLFKVDYWSALDMYDCWYGLEPPDGWEAALLERLRESGAGRRLLDETLSQAASAHAAEMHRLGYFGHYSPVPGNHGPGDRLAKAGWPAERRHVEILANADTDEAAFRAILTRPENGAALADPAYGLIGIGKSGDYWVVILGADQ